MIVLSKAGLLIRVVHIHVGSHKIIRKTIIKAIKLVDIIHSVVKSISQRSLDLRLLIRLGLGLGLLLRLGFWGLASFGFAHEL